MKTLTLEQRIEMDWVAGKFQQVLRNLRKLPEDIAAETIVVVADRVQPDNRLKLLEFLGDDLAGDGEVLSMLGL
ncbi:MAG: hypothetical protein KME05_00445 [Gloeocapsa sp. UFS-A4-WI-NPMV-4B04]|jgi:hypothetical protein|nr:hypothetical protein [Gloeocapsa sp. UFS-A4-WI-NPMV-4B04]